MITVLFIGLILFILLHDDNRGDGGNSGYGNSSSFGPHFFYGNQ